MAIAGAPGHAELQCVDPASGGSVEFHYNPTTLKLVKQVNWTPPMTLNADPGQPTRQNFRDVPPMTLSFDMFLDMWKGGAASTASSPAKVIAKLIKWANPTAHSPKGNPQPAIMRFNWGMQDIVREVQWFFTRLEVTLMMFTSSGAVTRAKVTVNLQQYYAPKPGPNPTSGGVTGRRAQTMRLGDSLQSVAHAEYGRPGLWRALAVANGIDDPLRVGPGTTILVPPPSDADTLS